MFTSTSQRLPYIFPYSNRLAFLKVVSYRCFDYFNYLILARVL